MNKLFDFSKMNPKLVERRKQWFMIPLIIFAITIIFGVAYGFAKGSPFALSMDFASGYSIDITFGSALTDDNENDLKKDINAVFENLSNSEGSKYGLSVDSFTRQGENAKNGFNVKYRAAKDPITGKRYSDSAMIDINDELRDELELQLFPGDKYGGNVSEGDSVSASVSNELIVMAVCAVLLAVTLMLIYIAIRFELLSGIAAIICLLHDLLIMSAFMLIFQIPLASTFIAALITILGYSINNTIIIFDRIRDINKSSEAKHMMYDQIANNAIMTTLTRSINTTGTTFITVFMVGLFSLFFGVIDMVYFCLPLLAGLIAGMFSSILMAPSIWSMWKNREDNRLAAAKHNPPKNPSDGHQDAAISIEPVSGNN